MDRAGGRRPARDLRPQTFAIEVSPEMFEFIEGVFEPPEPAELAGAIISESA